MYVPCQDKCTYRARTKNHLFATDQISSVAVGSTQHNRPCRAQCNDATTQRATNHCCTAANTTSGAINAWQCGTLSHFGR